MKVNLEAKVDKPPLFFIFGATISLLSPKPQQKFSFLLLLFIGFINEIALRLDVTTLIALIAYVLICFATVSFGVVKSSSSLLLSK